MQQMLRYSNVSPPLFTKALTTARWFLAEDDHGCGYYCCVYLAKSKGVGITMSLLKRLAAMLPHGWQNELKRKHFRREIRRDRFYTSESEFDLLPSFISAGDWV